MTKGVATWQELKPYQLMWPHGVGPGIAIFGRRLGACVFRSGACVTMLLSKRSEYASEIAPVFVAFVVLISLTVLLGWGSKKLLLVLMLVIGAIVGYLFAGLKGVVGSIFVSALIIIISYASDALMPVQIPWRALAILALFLAIVFSLQLFGAELQERRHMKGIMDDEIRKKKTGEMYRRLTYNPENPPRDDDDNRTDRE